MFLRKAQDRIHKMPKKYYNHFYNFIVKLSAWTYLEQITIVICSMIGKELKKSCCEDFNAALSNCTRRALTPLGNYFFLQRRKSPVTRTNESDHPKY